MPSQAASRLSFFSTTSFTFPQVTSASVPQNPFEIKPSSSGSHNPVLNSQCQGSSVAPYVPTPASEFGQLVSISAMPCYSDKSHEELRSEDHKLRNWSTEKPFEFSSTSKASTDSSARYSLFGGPPSRCESVFSSSKCGFQSESSIFGSQNSTNQQPRNPFQVNVPRSNSSGPSSGGTSSFSFSTTPYCNPTSTTENTPSQVASRPSFFSAMPFTFPQAPTSVTENPFEYIPSSSSTQSFDCGSHNHAPNGQCQGSLVAPYVPTPASEIGLPIAIGQLVSISAMPAYSEKSHEELRSEDYKLRGWSEAKPFEFSSTSRASKDPSPKYNLFGGPTPTCEGPFISSKHGFQSESAPFGSKSSNQQPSSSVHGNTPTSNSFGQPYQPGNYGVPFGKTTLPGFGQPYQPGNGGVNWSSPSFGTTTLPGFSSHNAGTLSQDKTGFRGSSTCNHCCNTFASTSAAFPGTSPGFIGFGAQSGPCFASPCWPITGWGFVPCFHPFANAPSIIAPYAMGFIGVNPFCGPQSTANASVPSTDPDKLSNKPLAFGSPIEVSEGSTNELQPTNKEPATESKPATTSDSADHHENKDKADNVLSVPKGMEIIVEKLGVNPWAESSTTKEIIPCEEAEKDEAIIALAEFAVEQHNAMNQGSKMSLTRVLGACLEAVECGRYHIVIETKDATDELLKRFYAVVLQRRTDLQTLVLLEKWLPGQPNSVQDS